jgi:hypothetical protein
MTGGAQYGVKRSPSCQPKASKPGGEEPKCAWSPVQASRSAKGQIATRTGNRMGELARAVVLVENSRSNVLMV